MLSTGAVDALDAVAELRSGCGMVSVSIERDIASSMCFPECDGNYDWMIIEPVSHF